MENRDRSCRSESENVEKSAAGPLWRHRVFGPIRPPYNVSRRAIAEMRKSSSFALGMKLHSSGYSELALYRLKSLAGDISQNIGYSQPPLWRGTAPITAAMTSVDELFKVSYLRLVLVC